MKNNRVKGVGSYTIKRAYCTCTECHKTVEVPYTWQGACADCRAKKYNVAPHMAMEYEFKNGLRSS